jgi:phosphopantetheinyl transferase
MVAFTIISLESAAATTIGLAELTAQSGIRRPGAEQARAGHVARAALRQLLRRRHPGVDWTFAADARGKLFATSGSGHEGPAVSISHTRGWVACAVADHPVGIDIEAHRPRDHAAIAEYAFGARENALVRSAGVAGFYRIWTVREAISKATGDGLALVTDARDRADEGPDVGRWTTSSEQGTWLLAHMRPAPSVSAAIALLSPNGSSWDRESFEEVEPDALM